VQVARATTGCFIASLSPDDRTAPSQGKVDPMMAVERGQPRVLPHARTPWVNRQGATCDAAHDHCLMNCTWLVTTSQPPYRTPPELHERIATAEGFDGLADDEVFVAYRSAPATATDLSVGRLVIANSEPNASSSGWTMGEVESVDVEGGRVRLRDHRPTYALAMTRVAVLSYARGGKVQAVPVPEGAAPAVTAGAGGGRAAAGDAWSQVGSDGQPREVTDARVLDTATMTCGPAENHCLRGWVWLVVDGRYAYPARFHDGAFHAVQGDDTFEPGRAAYRTLPATAANLKPGAMVVSHSELSDEKGAHTRWEVGVVESVAADRGRVVLKDGGEEPIAQVRVLVVMWFPGDRAEAMP